MQSESGPQGVSPLTSGALASSSSVEPRNGSQQSPNPASRIASHPHDVGDRRVIHNRSTSGKLRRVPAAGKPATPERPLLRSRPQITENTGHSGPSPAPASEPVVQFPEGDPVPDRYQEGRRRRVERIGREVLLGTYDASRPRQEAAIGAAFDALGGNPEKRLQRSPLDVAELKKPAAMPPAPPAPRKWSATVALAGPDGETAEASGTGLTPHSALSAARSRCETELLGRRPVPVATGEGKVRKLADHQRLRRKLQELLEQHDCPANLDHHCVGTECPAFRRGRRPSGNGRHSLFCDQPDAPGRIGSAELDATLEAQIPVEGA